MGRLILITAFFILSAGTVVSQPDNSYPDIDRRTYQLYLDGSWRELIRTGERALDRGIDFFYLRMRIGIAAYELKDYSKSARHFKKALEFNSADAAAMEYLYFSYLFLGQDMEARKVAAGFPDSLKDKLSYRRSAVRSVSLFTTGGFLDDQRIIDDYSININPALDGFQSITRSFMFFGASLVHDAGSGLQLTHSAGYLSKSHMVYRQEDASPDLERDARLSQMQYYLSGRILLGEGIYLVPSIHYLNVRIPYYTQTAGRGGRVFMMRQHVSLNDVAASLGLEKFSGKIRSGIFAGYSYINSQPQMQGSMYLGLLPLGNLNLYSVSTLTWYSDIPLDDGRWVYSQDIGFRIWSRLWAEIGGSRGDRENFAGPRASVIYNEPAVTSEQYGVTLIMPFFDMGMELFVNYNYMVSRSRFIPDNDAGTPVNQMNLVSHLVTGGIKWKF